MNLYTHLQLEQGKTQYLHIDGQRKMTFMNMWTGKSEVTCACTQPKQDNDTHSYRWTEQGVDLHLHTEGRGVTVFAKQG